MLKPTRIPDYTEVFDLIRHYEVAAAGLSATADLKLNEAAVLLRRGDVKGSQAAHVEAMVLQGIAVGWRSAGRKITELFGITDPNEAEY